MLEILAPAGSYDSALAAINNGANAIYLGLSSSFSARQSAENFDKEAFRAIVLRAHLCGVKVYLALNTVVQSGEEIDGFFKDLLFAWNEGTDAIILQDIFLGKLVHEKYPEIVLHLSTQAGVCNVYGAELAKEYGFSRVILARETPLAEIERIAQIIETEAFIHGALCTCFSGQCYFSSFVGGNSGNRGRCKQPCRKKYAYDRNGNTEKSYALSLSDLCVGEDIAKLINAGVVSFKIEGRMRRPEYVAAAVRYYRGILDNCGDITARLSDLKRAYNRGNYTKGLAFGQDKRFLSTAIQGHLGEKVGVVKVVNGQYLVESRFIPQKGDGFKIIRDGEEIGGATYAKTLGKCFVVESKNRLKNGDGVFITTDTAVMQRVLSAERKGLLSLALRFVEGEFPVAIWNGAEIVGDECLQTAQNRPLTADEVRACFTKTDGLPMDIVFEEASVVGNIFIPKSTLNAFRRKVFATICDEIQKYNRAPLLKQSLAIPTLYGKNNKTAVISDDFNGINVDVAVYNPKSYAEDLPIEFTSGNFEKYLYLPAFATSTDLEQIAEWLQRYSLDGIYAENYGGIAFAMAHNVKVFAGTGFNITNAYSLAELLRCSCLSYYAISKELNEKQAAVLVCDKAFALSSGNIKIMDLCYCPFGKTCAKCDKRDVYSLTDENGRVFPTRRYLASDGNCRFEVYNCADLVGVGVEGAGQLLDFSVVEEKMRALQAKDTESAQKTVYRNCTSGHYKRGVL